MKKVASKVKQTTRQSNTAHPRQSLFHMYMYICICSFVEFEVYLSTDDTETTHWAWEE